MFAFTPSSPSRPLSGFGLSALLVIILTSCTEEPRQDAPGPQSAAGLVLPSSNVIDLTHSFDSETIYWPTADGFSRQVTAEGTTERDYFYAAGNFSSAEHGGTHIDAPFHFAADGQTVEEIPLDRLMGPAIVIDVTNHVVTNPDYRITSSDIERWELEHRPIPDGVIVLLRTGFAERWPDRERYLGTSETGPAAVANLHFPGLHAEAASWLVENRNVAAIGLDTPSIDYGQSQNFEAHQILFRENIPVFENVANLDDLPAEGSIVVALPMKIERGSGAPLRIIAFVP